MKKILLNLILLMSIIMAGTVAYVSVGGLLKVFSGAGTLGVILFTSIEVAKVIATSAIHTYGKILGWKYNLLLSLGVVIAMAITSMGIYGFLSSTYKESYSKMVSIESKIELNNSKSEGYKTQLISVSNEKEGLSTIISELSSGLSNNVIEYKDKETGKIIRTTSSSTRRALEKQLDRASVRQELVSEKYDKISNKIFEIENEVLEIKLGNDVASELGPLKYLAEVTGMSMDDIMKWFIFLLIIIGDPMAILMVIVFNKVANIERQSREKDIEISIIPSKIKEEIKEEIEEEIKEEIEEEIKEEIKEDKEEIEDIEEEIEDLEEEIEEEIEEIEEEIKEGDTENDEVLERLKRLEEKERIIKEKEDDVKRLNKEIKDWENTHWKLKRNRKPPST
tara:strand:- start:12142 stop:13323 length:1182 start_codon:yes stop_codon:yes gene_type:complete